MSQECMNDERTIKATVDMKLEGHASGCQLAETRLRLVGSIRD